MNKILIGLALYLVSTLSFAEVDLIINTDARKTVSLNGTWHYIVDPYETGYYNRFYKKRGDDDEGAYWKRGEVETPQDRVEHGYTDAHTLEVPGDWNSQVEKLFYYEGTIWYQRNFAAPDLAEDERLFLYFGAVNYEAKVFVNDRELGSHKGGFTPFNFEIPRDLLKAEGNNLVVKVDNSRHPQEVPTVNTDWHNYGGITRDVKLVVTLENFIQEYSVQLSVEQDIVAAQKANSYQVAGNIQLNQAVENAKVGIAIPELDVAQEYQLADSELAFELELADLELWSPENPKLYDVELSINGHTIADKIGFRKIEVDGHRILLNGEQLILRGISMHEENPLEGRRAHSREDAELLLGWVKDLNANMVRLAHYPHNENTLRLADEMGLLIWSEIPVYWTIDFTSDVVLGKAKIQLEEMITRDQNRASVIIWSVGNETPPGDARLRFMTALIDKARELDDSRLISAALEKGHGNAIDDPLGEHTDILAVNQYMGWYYGNPDKIEDTEWNLAYDKPMYFSEFGGGALQGFHAKDKSTMWSEEYQEWIYQGQVAMLRNMPENFAGASPWLLVDFRSPKRNNPEFQQGWNRKGLIGSNGKKKKAFDVLRDYYLEVEKQQQ